MGRSPGDQSRVFERVRGARHRCCACDRRRHSRYRLNAYDCGIRSREHRRHSSGIRGVCRRRPGYGELVCRNADQGVSGLRSQRDCSRIDLASHELRINRRPSDRCGIFGCFRGRCHRRCADCRHCHSGYRRTCDCRSRRREHSRHSSGLGAVCRRRIRHGEEVCRYARQCVTAFRRDGDYRRVRGGRCECGVKRRPRDCRRITCSVGQR